MNKPMMEIDLVYMWVDGSDPAWREKKARYLEGSQAKHFGDSTGECRFAENDELKYSLRSVEKFAPWIRRIYIVTDGQVPAWLDTTNPRIRIVDHREILPADILPVFNSTVIEWALPHIPGLAERFLLSNDDTFFGAPVGPEFFFADDGFPIVRLKFKRVARHLNKIYPYKLYCAQQKIRRLYGKHYTLAPHHNIDAYCRDEFLACAEQFRAEVARTQRSRFRCSEDLSRAIVGYFALARKHAHMRRVNGWGSSSNPLQILRALLGGRRQVDSRYFPVHSKDLPALFRLYNPSLFCLNDDESVVPEDRLRMRCFLEELFPLPSSFEKTDSVVRKL